MKKSLMLASCAVLLSGTAMCTEIESAGRVSGCYFNAFGGANWVNSPKFSKVKYKTSRGSVVGAIVGHRIDIFSVEGEYAYRHNDITQAASIAMKGDLTQHSVFVNAIASAPVDYHLVPYAGFGVGYRYIQALGQPHHEWGIYQAKAGFNLAIAERVKLFADYTLVNSFYKNECLNHNLSGGIKVIF